MTLGAQLGSSRDRLFVGRQDELAAVDDLLSGATSPKVLYIHGMGGIGKSELLRAIRRRTRDTGWEVLLLDARDLPDDPENLLDVLLGTGIGKRPRLLMLDSFELLAGLERPLREQALPALPASWRVILAGRNRLGPAWTADSGWSTRLRSIALGELSRGEATEYLRLREVDPNAVEEILDFAGGVPLVLALASGAAGITAARTLDDHPDVVDALLASIMVRAPSPAHYRVVAISALVQRTTEELVSLIVGDDRATELFAWLAARPSYRADVDGVYPHEVVRQLLVSRLQRQRPDLVQEILVAAGNYHDRCLARQIELQSAADGVQLPMLSAGAVTEALKTALKHADRPDVLGDNPLCDLRVVSPHLIGAETPLDRGRALVAYLRNLTAETFASPRDELHHRALVRTYFEPTWPKQHAVAADLGMGYSTYRRYLATAIERLASTLLHLEVAARRGPIQ